MSKAKNLVSGDLKQNYQKNLNFQKQKQRQIHLNLTLEKEFMGEREKKKKGFDGDQLSSDTSKEREK